MLEKLLGKKKSSDQANGKGKITKKGGFLELDEIEEAKSPGEIAQVATKVVSQAVTEVSEVVTEAVSTTVEAVETTVDNVKAKAGKKGKKETAPQSAPKPEAAAPTYEQPEWVKVMYKNTNETQKPVEPAGFASEYQTPTPTTSRRRPGPSLNKFVNLARQVKKPGNRG